MKTKAVKDGNDWVINGTKHFISNAHISDFVVLFASTGEDDKGRNLLSCFLVDLKQKGVEVAKGYDCVSHRGYVNNILILMIAEYLQEIFLVKKIKALN